MWEFIADNSLSNLKGRYFRQNIGIRMETSSVSLLVNLFFIRTKFLQEVLNYRENRNDHRCPSTLVSVIYNLRINIVYPIYPDELVIKATTNILSSASYPELNLYIDGRGCLISKRDNLNFCRRLLS